MGYSWAVIEYFTRYSRGSIKHEDSKVFTMNVIVYCLITVIV